MDSLWDPLRDGRAHLYICGVRGMERGIEAIFEARARAEGLDWDDFRAGLVRARRLSIETTDGAVA
jgi:sulfite reductase alpha subunit-like flavoprotein